MVAVSFAAVSLSAPLERLTALVVWLGMGYGGIVSSVCVCVGVCV